MFGIARPYVIARRVALGLGANIFDKLVIAGVQLLLVPVLAIHWGLQLYGSWVLLSTIPSFLALSDFGFATAGGTRMTMLVSQNQCEAAVRVFQSTWLITLLTSIVMISLTVSVTLLVPNRVLPTAETFSTHEARVTLVLLLLYGVVALQCGIFQSGFRCAGLYAVGTLTHSFMLLSENLAVVAVVICGAGPVVAASALLGCRALALLIQGLMLRRQVPWLHLGIRQANAREARSLLFPAIAVMMIPLAQASFLQGTALALGIAASKAAVPAFTATRTLSRIGLQIPNLLNHALMPEYSAAVARGNRHAQGKMLALTIASSALTLAPFALVLVLFGPRIVALWTHGVILASPSLTAAMAATVVLGGIWGPLSNFILAMNRHSSFAYSYVVLALVTMPAAYVLSRWMADTGAALAMIALDAGMCLVILRLSQRMFVGWREIGAASRDFVGEVQAILRGRGVNQQP